MRVEDGSEPHSVSVIHTLSVMRAWGGGAVGRQTLQPDCLGSSPTSPAFSGVPCSRILKQSVPPCPLY